MLKGSSSPNSVAHVSFKRDLYIGEKRRIKEKYNRDLTEGFLQDIQGREGFSPHSVAHVSFKRDPWKYKKRRVKETC